jgi:PAS domain S-box-containing protein
MREKPLEVLVVEDETIHRRQIEHIFISREDRFSITCAGNIQEAAEKLQNNGYHLIIADVFLPDGKGMQLLTDASLQVDIPVIMISGKGNEAIAAESIKAGAWEYIIKSEDAFRDLPEKTEQVYREWRYKQQQQKAERELRETQSKLDQMLQTMAEGMILVNTSGEITYANPAANRILELSRDQIVGTYYQAEKWQQIDENGDPLPREALPLSIALGEQREALEVEHGIVSTRKKKWLSVNAAPLFDENGELSGAIASFRDITERKKMEWELEHSLHYYLTIIDQLPNPILKTDATGQCDYVNTAWTEFTGNESHMEMGEGWLNSIVSADRERFQSEFTAAFSKQQSMETECRFKRHDGARRWCLTTGRPFNSIDGYFAGYIFSLNDITEMKEEEEGKLQELNRELQSLEKLSNQPSTGITARAYGIRPLREQLPIVFDQCVKRFSQLLEKTIEEKTYKVDYDLSSELRSLSKELGGLNAGPRDIIEIYSTALREKNRNAGSSKSRLYSEEGRLLALELMGYTLSYYRNYYVSPEYSQQEKE